MSPRHSISFCPICGGGLCGVRVCGIPKKITDDSVQKPESKTALDLVQDPAPICGLIVCDECEAIWLEPDVNTDHFYPHSVDATCPICCGSLWEVSRWATTEDVAALGWEKYINHELDILDINPEGGQV